ncbi:MAG TPA: GPW/gp25 family protein [Bryobacteraceae bacterium]|nr:GPW/gp25 family protein [Bryobacteraceae bacterium]
MNPPRYRAWRFVHPDFDAPEERPGIQNSPTGGLATVEEAASVRQSILLLLSTRTGERVMRPEYGTDLHRLVFSPNDNTTAGLAIHYVRRALNRWEPRIEIVHLDAARAIRTESAKPDAPASGSDASGPDMESFLTVVLHYRVRSTQHTERISFSLNLAGELI